MTKNIRYLTQTQDSLPPRFSINDSVNRTLSHQKDDQDFGVGFITKFNITKDFTNFKTHDFACVYVLRGLGQYIDDKKKTYALSAGSVFFRMPGKKHTTIIDPRSQWTECFLRLTKIQYNQLSQLNAIQISCPVLQPGLDISFADKWLIFLERLKIAADHQLPNIWSELVSLLTSILINVQEPIDITPHRKNIELSCKILSSNLENRISLERVAKDVHLSYTYFRRLFKSQMGLSPGEYRIHRRLDRAKAFLLSKNSSIKEISYLLGYPDPFTFSEQFKKFVGCAPKDFK
ncbi:MAG: hypothetical protein COA79_03720 [Planctomycetota bacterium]|nr:MAG: hypothetical protein COA79_03720 [Planctomycetota bacterium]